MEVDDLCVRLTCIDPRVLTVLHNAGLELHLDKDYLSIMSYNDAFSAAKLLGSHTEIALTDYDFIVMPSDYVFTPHQDKESH